MSKPYEILVLGNNLAGAAAVHYLLKHTIPALEGLKADQAYHVTMVGPSKNTFFKICAPRVLVAPELISLEQVALPTAEQFAQYPKEKFVWVQGLATGLDETAKSVTIAALDQTTSTLAYDSLIVATGSSLDPLWAANDDFSATQASFDAMHAAFPTAKTVLIAGAGPVGVETAGEIMSKYPKMKVTLLSGSDRVLSGLSANTSSKAQKMLQKKGVEVVHKKKATSPAQSSAQSTSVTFDDGSSQTYDIYIHAIGGRPNTGFLPAAWLDERYKVKVDRDTMRGPVADVYALGDAGSYSKSTVMDLQFSWGAVMSAIGQDLAAHIDAKNNRTGPFRDRKFKPLENSQFVPVGRSGGVAQVMGWGLPSFFVWLIKCRTFFLEKAKPAFDGSDYSKV